MPRGAALRPGARQRRPALLLVASLTHPHDPFADPAGAIGTSTATRTSTCRARDIAGCRTIRIRSACAMSRTWTAHESPRPISARARRAYYGAISYVDDQLGRLMKALERLRARRRHDRRLHRRSWRDAGRARPLVQDELLRGCVPACRWSSPRPASSSRGACRQRLARRSAADAGRARRRRRALAMPRAIDGRSLLPHLAGAAGMTRRSANICGEGAIAPMVMIRRGSYKFIHSPRRPRPALRPRGRSAGARQSRQGPGPCGASRGFPRRGRRAGTRKRWRAGDRQPAAPASGRRVAARQAQRLGLSAEARCLAQLYAQQHRARRSGGPLAPTHVGAPPKG